MPPPESGKLCSTSPILNSMHSLSGCHWGNIDEHWQEGGVAHVSTFFTRFCLKIGDLYINPLFSHQFSTFFMAIYCRRYSMIYSYHIFRQHSQFLMIPRMSTSRVFLVNFRKILSVNGHIDPCRNDINQISPSLEFGIGMYWICRIRNWGVQTWHFLDMFGAMSYCSRDPELQAACEALVWWAQPSQSPTVMESDGRWKLPIECLEYMLNIWCFSTFFPI